MDGGAEPPSGNGGEFLLSLLQGKTRNQNNSNPLTTPSPPPPGSVHQSIAFDQAIAAVGSTVNISPPSIWLSNGFDPYGMHTLPWQPQSVDSNRLGFTGTGKPSIQSIMHPPPPPQSDHRRMVFGSFSEDETQFLRNEASVASNSNTDFHEYRAGYGGSGRGFKSTPPPPGFSSNQRGRAMDLQNQGVDLSAEVDRLRRLSIPSQQIEHPGQVRDLQYQKDVLSSEVDRLRRLPTQNESRFNLSQQIEHPGQVRDLQYNNDVLSAEVDILRRLSIQNESRFNLSQQIKHPGPAKDTNLHSVSAANAEYSFSNLNKEPRGECSRGEDENETNHKDDEKKNSQNSRDKDWRMDNRGEWLLSQRLRTIKRTIPCRIDIHRYDAPFMALYKSLIPSEDELEKQKQLMARLENLVGKEWSNNAKLYLYGSCANSFGFRKSDIDICLALKDEDFIKSEVLLKLTEILQSDGFQNVQALPRARVPIVKFKDPITGISCDICINNVLAVVNTKLLADYARIDVRLRQLAFIVKHWAKSRKVNETYRGTLSSYAYVVMCIHFLQQRRPPILPCLQEIDPTYSVMVDNIRCSYFDNVDRLSNFGSINKESIAELVWGFFSYWAYGHDYANSVVSVRTGSILGKREKDWTRRVGNDRHLICIEDPFETSHDLGRVVDKFSIRVLREEFERAAMVMHHDPNPCVQLFEPYLPQDDNVQSHTQTF